jgi:hypothetical protein
MAGGSAQPDDGFLTVAGSCSRVLKGYTSGWALTRARAELEVVASAHPPAGVGGWGVEPRERRALTRTHAAVVLVPVDLASGRVSLIPQDSTALEP